MTAAYSFSYWSKLANGTWIIEFVRDFPSGWPRMCKKTKHVQECVFNITRNIDLEHFY